MSNPPPKRPRSRRRKWLGWLLFLVVLWRAWPMVGIFTGWNLRGAITAKDPSAEFLPPASVPAEIRSGRAHPGFDSWQLVAELVFLPVAMRHGHAFQRDDPALSEAVAGEMAKVLADASTYSGWLGEAACGGFHGDWYLRWGEGADKHEAIVCEGCHEVLLYHGGLYVRCDFTKEGYKRLMEAMGKKGF